jgi:predicted Fe-Mo cluster-binding NifX family protein
MLIAVSSTGQNLNSQLDPRFGRCQYFVFVDSESMEFEAVANPNMSASGGAGIQSAQMIADRGTDVVLTGNCGPNAFQTLSAAGVQVVTAVSGTVRDAVESYKSGQILATSGPNVAEYSGMGGIQQPGRGAGMGMGRGGGRGRGGMGRGRMGGFGAGGIGAMASNPVSQSQAPVSNLQPQQAQSSSSEVQVLREQIDTLQRHVQQLTEKLQRTEENRDST